MDRSLIPITHEVQDPAQLETDTGFHAVPGDVGEKFPCHAESLSGKRYCNQSIADTSEGGEIFPVPRHYLNLYKALRKEGVSVSHALNSTPPPNEAQHTRAFMDLTKAMQRARRFDSPERACATCRQQFLDWLNGSLYDPYLIVASTPGDCAFRDADRDDWGAEEGEENLRTCNHNVVTPTRTQISMEQAWGQVQRKTPRIRTLSKGLIAVAGNPEQACKGCQATILAWQEGVIADEPIEEMEARLA
ncbi:hypothetical protein HN748_03765 [Candidatus Peregrinibacteria bacterium]|jgi:hypothetical protein|nr:hypothetical protein [Candidatus Peregrinibacteria bacterium]MBT7484127.1 hypothetical protein [Candidatus Peregrinibacteria bacterium]MBT7703326.1 hypothetical protein [Candidatus Peregrinibacteria bacterium]